MKITFTNGSVGHFKLWHEYGSDDRYCIKHLTEALEIYTSTIEILKPLPSGCGTESLIKWYEDQIRGIKGDISRHKQRPVKTHCTFEYQDTKVEDFSSISQEDASKGLHNRKIGRQTAIRNLLYKSRIAFSVEVRTELAKALMHLIK